MEIIPIAKMVNIMATIQSVSPIETAARSERNLLFILAAWIVISALVTGVLTVLLYKKTGKYQEAVKVDADARISESNAEAKRAGESAGLANERAGVANEVAGKANQRAEELEAANLTLRSQVATLETQAADAKKDVAGLQKAASDALAEEQRVQTELETQKERTAALETTAAKQQERAAKAEKELLEVKKNVVVLKVGRRWLIMQLGTFLKDKPNGSVEITYASNNDDAFMTAREIGIELEMAGWKITGRKLISADDPNQVLPMFATPEMKGNPFNLTPFEMVGGQNDITVLISPADADKETGFPREGTAAHTLYFAIISCRLEPSLNFDKRLPAGSMRLVVRMKE
jgi:regulator of replication initiation timing